MLEEDYLICVRVDKSFTFLSSCLCGVGVARVRILLVACQPRQQRKMVRFQKRWCFGNIFHLRGSWWQQMAGGDVISGASHSHLDDIKLHD